MRPNMRPNIKLVIDLTRNLTQEHGVPVPVLSLLRYTKRLCHSIMTQPLAFSVLVHLSVSAYSGTVSANRAPVV